MKKPWFEWIFCPLIILPLVISPAVATAAARDAFEKLRPLLFQIKTSVDGSLGKSSYGTGFVIDRRGLLITNYHVVASAIWRPQSHKIYAEIDGEAVPLKIRAVDFRNDLALVAIDRTFESEVKVASSPPRQGDSIHSLGLPADVGWTVVTGVFNGLVEMGPYQQFHMSTSINSGMSGGPTVNDRNELVAVNVSVIRGAGQISFGVPAKFVKDLYETYRDKEPMGEKQMLDRLADQLQNLGAQMTEIIVKAYARPKLSHGIEFPRYPGSVRCWSDSDSEGDGDDEVGVESRGESCRVNHDVSLSGNMMAGMFSDAHRLIKNRKLEKIGWDLLQGKNWEMHWGMVDRFDRKSKVNILKPKCFRQRIEIKGYFAPKTVSLCLQDINPLGGVYDAYLTVHAPLTKDSFMRSDLTLSGFSLDQILTVVRSVVQARAAGEEKAKSNKTPAPAKVGGSAQ